MQKLEDVSGAPDELGHACREAPDFASHFRVSYGISCLWWKRSSPCFLHVPTTEEVPHSIRLSVELLSLLATQQKWFHYLQQVKSLIPHINMPYKVYTLVYPANCNTCVLCVRYILLYSSLDLLITVVFI